MQPDQTMMTDLIPRLTRTEGYLQVGPGNWCRLFGAGLPEAVAAAPERLMAIAYRLMGGRKHLGAEDLATVVDRHAGE